MNVLKKYKNPCYNFNFILKHALNYILFGKKQSKVCL